MTDGGVHTGYYFIERLGSRQTEPLVADFIFGCDSCAKRIATALWHGRQERVVAGENFSSDRETNRWVY
jgi:hypothetical protein